MSLIDLQIAVRNLTKHTKRNVFLGGAIAAVTLLLVLMGGLTQGMRAAMLESATTLMTGHVNVGGFYKVTSGTSAPLVTECRRRSTTRAGWCPRSTTSPSACGAGRRASPSAPRWISCWAASTSSGSPASARVVQVKEGSLAELAKPDTVLLFEDQARRLEVKVGDAITLSAPTSRGVNNTADLRVAAIARNIGILSSFSAFMPAETLRRLYQLERPHHGRHPPLPEGPHAGAAGGGEAPERPRARPAGA